MARGATKGELNTLFFFNHVTTEQGRKAAIPMNDLKRMLRGFDVVRQLDREMPAQLVSTFLYIASRDGHTTKKQDVEKRLGLTTASSSRCIDWLCDKHRLKHKPGLGLVRKLKQGPDLRVVYVELTDKGRELANQILSELA